MTNPFEEIDKSFKEIKQELSELKDLLAHAQSQKIRDIGNIDMAVEESGLSKHRIYKLAPAGQFPCIKKGGRLYFSRTAIREWIKSGNRP